jgi:sugar phosphate isomerase/epimerase
MIVTSPFRRRAVRVDNGFMLRREFVASMPAGVALAGMAATPRIGVDLFSLRSQGWTAFEHLDYCARQGAKVVHFSEIRFLGSLEDEHVKKVAAHARQLGIELEIGMRSICPASNLFDPKQGTGEEQLARLIRAGQIAGSKVVRAFLGNSTDRKSPGGIEARIEDAAKVLKTARSRAQDAGVKIAIENHSGDMQGRELKTLIEAAGPDFVGSCNDTGNPLWTLEDPLLTLETLAPHVLTAHIRDSYLWATEQGAMVRWTRMGEGNIGMQNLLRRFVELCPGKTMSLEIIVTGPRPFNWRQPDFWKGYENVPAWSFARFAALAAAGKPQEYTPVPKEQAQARERADFEASNVWMRKFFAL